MMVTTPQIVRIETFTVGEPALTFELHTILYAKDRQEVTVSIGRAERRVSLRELGEAVRKLELLGAHQYDDVDKHEKERTT